MSVSIISTAPRGVPDAEILRALVLADRTRPGGGMRQRWTPRLKIQLYRKFLDGAPQADLAREYGVSLPRISQVLRAVIEVAWVVERARRGVSAA